GSAAATMKDEYGRRQRWLVFDSPLEVSQRVEPARRSVVVILDATLPLDYRTLPQVVVFPRRWRSSEWNERMCCLCGPRAACHERRELYHPSRRVEGTGPVPHRPRTVRRNSRRTWPLSRPPLCLGDRCDLP